MAAITIPDQSWREDRDHEAHQQRLLDAFIEGRRVGALILPMSLCPQELTEAERAQWLDGWRKATAEKADRRAA